MKELLKNFSNDVVVAAPPHVFRVQRSPYFFSCVVNLHISPDVPMFSLTKTQQTLLHISLSERREFPLPHSHQSCLCPQRLCTLVWREPPPVNARKIDLVFSKTFKWHIWLHLQQRYTYNRVWFKQNKTFIEHVNSVHMQIPCLR